MKTFAIFAKYWEKGKVKTRLAAAVGASRAAEIYFRFLRLSLKIPQNSRFEKVLAISPVAREPEFRKLAPDWILTPQIDSDLGTRMHYFFETTFRDGHLKLTTSDGNIDSGGPEVSTRHHPDTGGDQNRHRIVLIGSDTPMLPRSIIDAAFERLKEVDVVIGPSTDGGYYLIGARDQAPNIFEGVQWSSNQVLDQTIAKLVEHGYSYHLLDQYSDVDELEDLIGLIAELESQEQLDDDQIDLLRVAQASVSSIGRPTGVQHEERS